MPVPVALAAVGRLIASKGVREAVKKYGQKAVDEYRKMSAKASNKLDKAQGIKPSSPGRTSKDRGVVVGKDRTKAFKNTEQIKGGVKGAVAAGAGAAAGAALKKKKDEKSKAKPKAKPAPKKNSEKGTRVVGDKTGVKVYKDGKLVSNRKKKK